jgi:succinate dehydrogenase / fumarate reductase membrane anchor subunit
MMLLTGLRAHVWQRFSAWYLMGYFPLAVWYWWQTPTESVVDIQMALTNGLFLWPSLLAFALLMVHAWVGLRDVLLDYLPRKTLQAGLWVWALVWLLVLANGVFLMVRLVSPQ